MTAPVVSFVIPTLNEAGFLTRLLDDLTHVPIAHDVTVSDGGSRDETVRLAREAGCSVMTGPPSRGGQMARGASSTSGEFLCFLHADVQLNRDARGALMDAVADTTFRAGVWHFAVDHPALRYRVLERFAHFRSRLFGLPYGDQGLLVRRDRYEQAGGFSDVPLMEDVMLIRALRAAGAVRQFSPPVMVSARRWERRGIARQTLVNVFTLIGFFLGMSPSTLARWYRQT